MRPLSEYPEIMTVGEVAEYLRCSTSHVYREVDRGHLKATPRTTGARRALVRVYRGEVARYSGADLPVPEAVA